MTSKYREIAIGCDEAGFALKQTVIELLHDEEIEVKDYGCYSLDSVDYPDIGYEVAHAIARGEHDRGSSSAAPGSAWQSRPTRCPIRAAQVHDPYSAERSRKSNNTQIMTMGARVVGPELAKSLVRIWLASEFSGGESERKVNKITAGERTPDSGRV